ncbi:MAG: class IV adenylate cyclase [Anaerolineales bacterium]|nr:class IV adenylate cyclase [Anaerolineales bacterium]
MNDQEIEVKFYVKDLGKVAARLLEMCARLLRPRVHELNLRFDRPDGSLRREHRVLRLRQGEDARLTYKGPGSIVEGAMSRQEIEFSVGDFETAKAFLEALDYQLVVIYEKYRTTYMIETSEVFAKHPRRGQDLGGLSALIMLDELPYGNFVEIEGPDAASIHAAVDSLGLDWEARIAESYLALFERLCKARGFTFRDLSFVNFADTRFTVNNLGVQPADE